MKSGVSLQQMLTEVKRQSESKEDYLIVSTACGWNPTAKKCFCTCRTTVVPS